MIDFLKYRYICLALSLVILATGVSFYFLRGGFSYNIDFTGGTEVKIGFKEKQKISEIRDVIDSQGWPDSVVQNMEGDKDFILRVAADDGLVEQKVVSAISEKFGKESFEVLSVERVGPEAGQEVRWNAFISIVLALLLLLLYISLRHKYAYALGAIFALAHDLLVLITFYVVFNEQISLNILAGILSVLGYSLNDTIVVFNRIEENLHLKKEASKGEVVNLSLNQTLRRTILTSFTTFMSMLAIYIFGGEILKAFSLTMMIAVVVGTYSSIYIASPVMMYFESRRSS